MIEFESNPFESFPSNVLVSDIAPTNNKFPLWGWVIIVLVIVFIVYQIYRTFFTEKDEKDKD
jgi:uncharacterized membrane protein YdbT with pleckstrin-like domain